MPDMFGQEALTQAVNQVPEDQRQVGSRPTTATSSDNFFTQTPQDVGWGPKAAMYGGQASDVISTLLALQNPNLRETNPMGTYGTMAAKAGLSLLGQHLMKRLVQKGHPVAAKALGYGVGASGAVDAARNIHTMLANR